MNISLKICYKIEAVPVIRNFVAETAMYYGADAHESLEIGMASEEAAVHIITTYPRTDDDTPFDVICEKKKDFIRFTLSNMGVPVDVESIPSYDADNPDLSISGLSFFMIEKLTDNFEFVNLGQGGWRTTIDKKLKSLKYDPEQNKDDKLEKEISLPSGKLRFAMAKQSDAYEITKLAYFTYRYSYTKKTFYYPELLKEGLATQQIISFIVKNDKDEIVAHSALLRSENCRNIAEVGVIMAMPEYRRSTAVLRIVKETNRFLKGSDNFGIHLIESNLVTAHTGSQRICRSFKFTPLALKVSMHERATFVDIDEVSAERETLLYSILSFKTPSEIVIYPPDEHLDFISKLMTSTNLDFKICPHDSGHKFVENSQFMIQRHEDTEYANIIVTEIGADIFVKIKKILYDLSLENIKTISLQLPLSGPLPSELEKELNAMRFFFSGLTLFTTTKWQLLYTCIKRHEIDFGQIKVADKLAVDLKDYVENCYSNIIP